MSRVEATGWVGWARFAAVMIIVNGIFGVFQGLVALLAPDPYFVVTRGSLFLFNLTGWGWWTLIIGVLLILIGIAVLMGATWARVIAIILVIVGAVGQLLLLPAQPWWSSITIGVDILIIYALTVHGRELRSAA
jgi:hypothetical protein